MGTLCVMQFSSENCTLLIDIHTFKTKLNWMDEQFKRLFNLLFAHGKPIYGKCRFNLDVLFDIFIGFDFTSDINVICHNFPFFGKDILPNLTNLVCIHQSVHAIISDFDLSKIVFEDKIPEQLKLTSITERFLNFTLEKEEQVSIWSSRPLRKNQQFYAARDSYAVFEIKKILIQKIET
jgi:hypothetical protein